MASDDESTHQFDIEAMRAALAATRRSRPSIEGELPEPTDDKVTTIATYVAPPAPADERPNEPDKDDAFTTVARFVAPPREEREEDDPKATIAFVARAPEPEAVEPLPPDAALERTGENESLPAFPLEDDTGEHTAITAVAPAPSPHDPPLPRFPSVTPTTIFERPDPVPEPRTDEVPALLDPLLDSNEALPPAQAALAPDPSDALTVMGWVKPLPARVPARAPAPGAVPTADPSEALTTMGWVEPPAAPAPDEDEALTRMGWVSAPSAREVEVPSAAPSSELVADDDLLDADSSEVQAFADGDAELLGDEADDDGTRPGFVAEPEREPTMVERLGLEDPDEEEAALAEAASFGPLVALYRQRLAEAETTKRRASLYVKIARVYERGKNDARTAFDTMVEAFEQAPDNANVIAEVDRLGRATNRIAELADRVRRKLLPAAPEDRRAVYLAHLVFWYERVLNRSRDAAPLVADIERLDKVHPLLLRRAAQLAAMNGDTKTQREHLARALERTVRTEERVALHLALADAYAGTADQVRHYEAALQEDPSSTAALSAMKRVAKERQNHEQLRWVLERQVEVVATDAERVTMLLELAELMEGKFLRRDAAAPLLERVLKLQPGHPGALKALERCYHALRDWPRLARVLALRAERAPDKKTKVELLLLAADVHESKLGDPAGAVEVYRNLLVVDPKHRRALGDLARLYEKLGDWANLATYKARIAELAPTKRVMSQELVRLGDFLDAPDRDPIAAHLQYERAVVIDPSNTAAWEALQRVAAAAGNDRRVIECLEHRRDHTDIPRQRSAILVELATLHSRMGNHDAARKCYEAALKADPTNEVAAVVMFDAYVAEARWVEAAPVCELLVNAAMRDHDDEALFVRLRLATRIAAALGDADRAMMSAVAALDVRPDDPAAQADLVVMADQCREAAPTALPKGRAHLVAIAQAPHELSTENLVRLGTLLSEAKEYDLAAAMLERAHDAEPDDASVTKQLADVFVAQGDFPRACKLKVEIARDATSADDRFALLCEAGEIWARRAGELEASVSVFEEARAMRPLDPWLLGTLRWLYAELSDWSALATVYEDLAEAGREKEEKAAERIQALLALADLARDKLDDPARAAVVFDEILDADPKRLELFEEIVRIFTAEKAWEALVDAYRRMLDRVKDDGSQGQLRFLLQQQLGILYRDRLGDPEQAYAMFDAASQLRPEDPELRHMIVELLIATDNLDAAIARLQSEIDRDPHDADLYAELYELFLRQEAFDQAWCTVNILVRLREPTPEQRRFHDDYPPMALDTVPGQIVEQAWSSHLFHPSLDPTLTSLFAVLTPAVARLRWSQLRPEQRVGRPFTPKHSRMFDAVRTTFDNAAEILSLDPPELLLGDAKDPLPFTPALGPFGAVLVAGPAVEAQASALLYLVGKRLAEQRPELAARGLFPSVPELTNVLGMAFRFARGEIGRDPVTAALDQSFAAALDPQEATSLRKLALAVLAANPQPDVKAWLRAADLSSTRAGLLVAGDVEPARAAIVAEHGQTPAARDRIGELYKFAVSDLHSELRVAIGVAVSTDQR